MKINIEKDVIHIDLTQVINREQNESADRKEISVLNDTYYLPVLRGLPKTTHLVGRHRINPFYFNCNCKDYREKVKLYKKRDIRRVCKHIFSLFSLKFSDNLDELTRLLLEHQFWYRLSGISEIRFGNENLYLGCFENEKKIFVYRKNSRWHYYKFFPKQKVWENSIPPYKLKSDNDVLEEFLLRNC